MTIKAANEISTFEDEIVAFFSAYLSAFRQEDASAICELWD